MAPATILFSEFYIENHYKQMQIAAANISCQTTQSPFLAQLLLIISYYYRFFNLFFKIFIHFFKVKKKAPTAVGALSVIHQN
jgi:hypothetical protein